LTDESDLSPKQAARILGVGAETVRELLRSGKLTGYQRGSGGHWRITRASLDAYRKLPAPRVA